MSRMKVYDSGGAAWRYMAPPEGDEDVVGRLKVYNNATASWEFVAPITDHSIFRLSGVKDSPTDLVAGTYGDEFEYTSVDALNAVWTPRSGTSVAVNGSSVSLRHDATAGRGILRDATAFASDFEYAVLLQTHAIGATPVVVDSSGNGIGFELDAGTILYGMTVTAYNYGGDLSNTSYTNYTNDALPVWLAIRKSGTSYRLRASLDGTAWTTVCTSTKTFTVDRVGVLFIWGAASAAGLTLVHRAVYGAPDLGLG